MLAVQRKDVNINYGPMRCRCTNQETVLPFDATLLGVPLYLHNLLSSYCRAEPNMGSRGKIVLTNFWLLLTSTATESVKQSLHLTSTGLPTAALPTTSNAFAGSAWSFK